MANHGRVPKDELEKLTKKHLVEKPEMGLLGLDHGAFDQDGYICLKDNTYRICAPLPPETDRMVGCIFWTKTSPTDTSPS
jgi:hypothetical protein